MDEIPIIKDALSSPETDNEVYCIKTHQRLNKSVTTTHKVKIICNIRDVRDAFLSFMRFMRVDFPSGIKTMQGMMQTTDYYFDSFAGNMSIVRYDQIENDAIDIVNDICEYLDISVAEDTKRDIVEQYGKATIQKQLNDFNDIKIDSNGVIEDKELAKKFETVRNLDGTYRIFDKNSAFQSNHITSSKEGEWREYFNDAQISQIEQVSCEWLKKYGFEP